MKNRKSLKYLRLLKINIVLNEAGYESEINSPDDNDFYVISEKGLNQKICRLAS